MPFFLDIATKIGPHLIIILQIILHPIPILLESLRGVLIRRSRLQLLRAVGIDRRLQDVVQLLLEDGYGTLSGPGSHSWLLLGLDGW